jgi:hypothetical protein
MQPRLWPLMSPEWATFSFQPRGSISPHLIDPPQTFWDTSCSAHYKNGRISLIGNMGSKISGHSYEGVRRDGNPILGWTSLKILAPQIL